MHFLFNSVFKNIYNVNNNVQTGFIMKEFFGGMW